MSRSIVTIPKALVHLDARVCARGTALESRELSRVHAIVREQVPSEEISTLDKQGVFTRFYASEFRSPVKSETLHIPSNYWGTLRLERLRSPANYPGNIGLVTLARDLSALYGFCFNITDIELPEPQPRCENHLYANWPRWTYLLQLMSGDPTFMVQFADPSGHEVFAQRYFDGPMRAAGSDMCNLLAPESFARLNWEVENLYPPPPARVDPQIKAQRDATKHQGTYAQLLAKAQDMHQRFPDTPLGEFVEHLDNKKTGSPKAAMRSLGRSYWKIKGAGIDTAELDAIFDHHGMGYAAMDKLYEEYVQRAEEEKLSAGTLSEDAVKRGLMEEPTWLVNVAARHKELLNAFSQYAIGTKKLAALMEEHAPFDAFRRIVQWGNQTKGENTFLSFLGMRETASNSAQLTGRYTSWLVQVLADTVYAGPLRDSALDVLQTNDGITIFPMPTRLSHFISWEAQDIRNGKTPMGTSVLFMADPRESFARIVREINLPNNDISTSVFFNSYLARLSSPWFLSEIFSKHYFRKPGAILTAKGSVPVESIYVLTNSLGCSRAQFDAWRNGLASLGSPVNAVATVRNVVKRSFLLRYIQLEGNLGKKERIAILAEETGLHVDDVKEWLGNNIPDVTPGRPIEVTIPESQAVDLSPEEYLGPAALGPHRVLRALATIVEEHGGALGDAADSFSDKIEELRENIEARKTVHDRDVRNLEGKLRRALTRVLNDAQRAQEIIRTALSVLDE